MAKVSFTKLITIKNGETKTIDINGNEVTVKQYLPLNEKIEIIESVLNSAVDDMTDFSIVKLQVFTAIEMIKKYTNISFTETQEKDAPKLFDLLILNGTWDIIKENIPQSEFDFINDAIRQEATRISAYFHSAAGIFNAIKQDYDMTNMDVDGMLDKLKNGESVGLVRDILTKVN